MCSTYLSILDELKYQFPAEVNTGSPAIALTRQAVTKPRNAANDGQWGAEDRLKPDTRRLVGSETAAKVYRHCHVGRVHPQTPTASLHGAVAFPMT